MNSDDIKKLKQILQAAGVDLDAEKKINPKVEKVKKASSVKEIEEIVGKPMPPSLKTMTIALMNGLLETVAEANPDAIKDINGFTFGMAALLAGEMPDEVSIGLMATIEFWICLGKGLGLSEKDSANLMVRFAQDSYEFYKQTGVDANVRGKQINMFFEGLLNEYKYDSTNSVPGVVPDENKEGYYSKED